MIGATRLLVAGDLLLGGEGDGRDPAGDQRHRRSPGRSRRGHHPLGLAGAHPGYRLWVKPTERRRQGEGLHRLHLLDRVPEAHRGGDGPGIPLLIEQFEHTSSVRTATDNACV